MESKECACKELVGGVTQRNSIIEMEINPNLKLYVYQWASYQMLLTLNSTNDTQTRTKAENGNDLYLNND